VDYHFRNYQQISRSDLRNNVSNDHAPQATESITIVANSLLLLGDGVYNVVVLDEVGQLRRHWLSRIVQGCLGPSFLRFKKLLNEASLVVIMQDRISLEDVRFVTSLCGVDAEDRQKVRMLKLEKPRSMHPIKYTTEFDVALLMIKKHYIDSLKMLYHPTNENEDITVNNFTADTPKYKQSVAPFVIFCTAKKTAVFLVYLMKQYAIACGGDPDRVRGIWASLKDEDPWCIEFMRDPNTMSKDLDVLIATTVIGTGVSLDDWFVCYFGLIQNNIITVAEALQLIGRVRKSEISVESFLYIQKGGGRPAPEFKQKRDTLRQVQKTLLNSAPAAHTTERSIIDQMGKTTIRLLVNTRITVELERYDSFSNHLARWLQELQAFTSNTEEVKGFGGFSKQEINAERGKFALYNNCKREFIYEFTVKKDDGTITTCPDRHPALAEEQEDGEEDPNSYQYFRREVLYGSGVLRMSLKLDIEDCKGRLSSSFGNIDFVELIVEQIIKEEVNGSHIKKRQNYITKQAGYNLVLRTRRLAFWMAYYYRDLPLVKEVAQDIFSKMHYIGWRVASEQLRPLITLQAAWIILPNLFTSPDIKYVVKPAASPLFLDLVVSQHKSLCDYLKTLLGEPATGDEDDTDGRVDIQFKVRFILEDNSGFTKLTEIYNEPDKAHNFIKKLCFGIGMDLKGDGKKKQRGGIRKPQAYLRHNPAQFSLVLALRKNFRQYISEILPHLFSGVNLCNTQMTYVEEAIKIYNDAANNKNDLKGNPLHKFDIDHLMGTVGLGLTVRQRLREQQQVRETGWEWEHITEDNTAQALLQLGASTDEVGDDTGNDVQEALRTIRHIDNETEERLALTATSMYGAGADEASDDSNGYGNNTSVDKRQHNPFVLDDVEVEGHDDNDKLENTDSEDDDIQKEATHHIQPITPSPAAESGPSPDNLEDTDSEEDEAHQQHQKRLQKITDKRNPKRIRRRK